MEGAPIRGAEGSEREVVRASREYVAQLSDTGGERLCPGQYLRKEGGNVEASAEAARSLEVGEKAPDPKPPGAAGRRPRLSDLPWNREAALLFCPKDGAAVSRTSAL